MAVKIRLKRMGAKKRPFYRIVVADARSPRDGRFIESVGYYDPLRDPKVVKLEDERIRHWMEIGARPSDAVRELLERAGMVPATPRRARPGHPVGGPGAAAPDASPETAEAAEATGAAVADAAEPAVAVEDAAPPAEPAADAEEPAEVDTVPDPNEAPAASDAAAEASDEG